MAMAERVELLEHRVVFEGYHRVGEYHFRHSSLCGGADILMDREVFHCGQHACVLPYDPRRGEIVLVRQFRAGTYVAGRHPWTWELVGGVIEKGETAEEVVHREAVEEAGISLKALIPIYQVMACPGAMSETRTMFLGRADTRQAGGVFGVDVENENILAEPKSLAAAIEMMERGEILDLTCIAALQWLILHRREVDERWP